MRMPMEMVAVLIMLLAVSEFKTGVEAIDIPSLRKLAADNNFSAVFVFGDSSVDSGNNNPLPTTSKSNFPPYGKDFFGGRSTGRFSNGKLATDFIAEALGSTKQIKAFLDPHLTRSDLSHGVSFASGGSGYDNLTAQLSGVLTMTHQLEYFMHYKIHLRKLMGEEKARDFIKNAVFVLSMGTNDFLQNYYVEPTRSSQFNIQQYQHFLISNFHGYIKTMHDLGAQRLAVVGVPSIGCIPLMKTLTGQTECDERLNNVALSFNSKIKQALATIQTSIGIKTAYVDAYGLLLSAVQNPKRYGFEETRKGCCGTGTIEYGMTCKGLSTCPDRSKYVFWDAVHPTEMMYKIIADEALDSLIATLF